MPRSDDGRIRSGLNWLMASLVMAAPLACVGMQVLEEPLYVAGSPLGVSRAAHLASYFPDPGTAGIHARGSKDVRRIEALGHPLAMMR